MRPIAGRTIAITGAARGIGLATAQALLDAGARVVIGDRDLAQLGVAVSELSARGQVSGHPLDVTDAESCAAFLDHARAFGDGRIDVLINNAGIMPIGAFLGQPDQTIRAAVEVNLCGVLHGCRLALPAMIEQRSGHIVNISSSAGLVAVPGQVVYAATKHAVVGLTTALADEVAPHGVDVSVVMPPFTATRLIAGTDPGAAGKPVPPSDIAAAIVKLLHKPKTHVTVPGFTRFFAPFLTMLSPRGRRWFNKRLGTDRVFLDFDTDARRDYEDRASTATGVDGRPPQ